jgi:hypothetical protein
VEVRSLISVPLRLLPSAWIPSAEVEKTVTVDVPGAELSMEALGALVDGAAAETALRPLVGQYRAWIETRRATTRTVADSPANREMLSTPRCQPVSCGAYSSDGLRLPLLCPSAREYFGSITQDESHGAISLKRPALVFARHLPFGAACRLDGMGATS